MKNYLDLLAKIINTGHHKEDRTGTGTLSLFGEQLRFNLQAGFPLVTTKKVHLKAVIYELLWFLHGDTNIDYLTQHNVTIWNEWSNDYGDLGPIYGAQWRYWQSPDGRYIDQLQQVISQLKTKPHSRRILVSAWNIADLPDEGISPQENVNAGKMALAPCHVLFQFYVANGQLSCQLYQRSCDTFLGLPFNIASYALLTHLLAQQCHLQVGELIWTGGDVHLYNNHLEQARLQLTREPLPLPTLHINRHADSLFSYQFEDIELKNYQFHPAIKAPIAI